MNSDTPSVIEQVMFDLYLIEVSNGQLFKISERRFTDCRILTDNICKTSPRLYIQYHSDLPPDPKYFQESIFNSFPDKQERVNFLNKFISALWQGECRTNALNLWWLALKTLGRQRGYLC